MTDKTTQKILMHLSENARMSWAELGEKVHLTPQAIAVRVNKLVEKGDIGKFTITQPKLHYHFITVYLASPAFDEFEAAMINHPFTKELHKISGDGCYYLKIACNSNQELDEFLTFLLKFGRYALSSSVRQVV